MSEYVDLNKISTAERNELLHCIERYETIMATAANKGEANQGAAFKADVLERTRLYRSILSSNSRFPLEVYQELLLDLDHLKYTIGIMFGNHLSPFKKFIRNLTRPRLEGRDELEGAIDRTVHVLKGNLS